MIGRLQQVPLREVWPHEAFDFTTWLERNIDVLGETLGLSLTVVEREKAVGSFSVDLLAEDEAGNTVIIENQLGQSDHDHLGKLMTYLAGTEAGTAIWIVAQPRPEHVTAVTWLNESAATEGFYLLKLQAVKIGDSPPAPLLTLIVGPSETTREVGELKKAKAERHQLRLKFWQGLLDQAKEHSSLHANISANLSSGLRATPKRGFGLIYRIRQNDAAIEPAIDRGNDAEDENKTIFETFLADKSDIESEIGQPLTWDTREDRRKYAISLSLNIGGYRNDEGNWPGIQRSMVEAMAKFERAFLPRISKLKL